MKSEKKITLSKDYEELDTIKKRIAINYKELPWGIANAKVIFENVVHPPRKGYNYRFITVEAEYAGKKYIIRSVKGEVEGALMAMKKHIEKNLIK